MSQSLGMKGEASMSSLIALAVALLGVREFTLAAAPARLRCPPPAEREGKKEGGHGEGEGGEGDEGCWLWGAEG